MYSLSFWFSKLCYLYFVANFPFLTWRKRDSFGVIYILYFSFIWFSPSRTIPIALAFPNSGSRVSWATSSKVAMNPSGSNKSIRLRAPAWHQQLQIVVLPRQRDQYHAGLAFFGPAWFNLRPPGTPTSFGTMCREADSVGSWTWTWGQPTAAPSS